MVVVVVVVVGLGNSAFAKAFVREEKFNFQQHKGLSLATTTTATTTTQQQQLAHLSGCWEGG